MDKSDAEKIREALNTLSKRELLNIDPSDLIAIILIDKNKNVVRLEGQDLEIIRNKKMADFMDRNCTHIEVLVDIRRLLIKVTEHHLDLVNLITI